MKSTRSLAFPIIGFVLMVLLRLSSAQIAPSPAAAHPPASSDGTAIDQGIAYLLLFVALAVTYLPGVALKHAKEGTENSTFWAALGGKQNYASKKESQNITRDPHLYSFSINRVFVWVGHTVDPKEKQKAFEMGEKYIALAASLEGLPQQVPLYKITEGNEPLILVGEAANHRIISGGDLEEISILETFEGTIVILNSTAEKQILRFRNREGKLGERGEWDLIERVPLWLNINRRFEDGSFTAGVRADAVKMIKTVAPSTLLLRLDLLVLMQLREMRLGSHNRSSRRRNRRHHDRRDC
ncbi:hypothetical protein V2J09_018808 [Rumex salicifolius]